MEKISNLILPVIVVVIVVFGAVKKINVFDCFIEGAKRVLTLLIYCQC